MDSLKDLLLQHRPSATDVQRSGQLVQKSLLTASQYLDGPNFRRFHPDDLRMLFDLYDRLVFDGRIRKTIGRRPLRFRLSPRMTRAGGKTFQRVWMDPVSGGRLEDYEIALSSHLLFQTFRDTDQRSITVTGVPCRNRLEAMQRIMEHEIIHLCEMLVWDDSSCSAPRFQGIASRLFRHTEHTHELMTMTEIAQQTKGIAVGAWVTFDFEGRTLRGIVNRITKRATVLVPDPQGMPYTDGECYQKYYIPVACLKRAA